MKRTAVKVFNILCGMVVMLALAAGITSVPLLAATNGIYIAKATPHYRHPETGVIEDSGGDGSAVLGQSMTESALYRKALVEVDPDGNMYVTVRLKLMDNIQNPQFKVDGTPVSATFMQEDSTDNTADYRMKVNSEKSVIRCNMYVVPMGREVIFYITVSDLTAGSEDFITSVKVVETSKPAPVEKPTETKPSETPKTETPKTNTPTDTTEPETKTPETETPDEKTPDEPTVTPAEETKPTDENKDGKASGLEEFDESGNIVNEEETPKTEKSGNAVVWIVSGGIAVVAVAGFCVWYFAFFKKKR